MEYRKIPDELKQINNWVCRKGKIPYCPINNQPAKSTDPNTWVSFEQAEKAVLSGQYNGIGFAFDGTGIMGIDLDHVVDKDTGAIEQWAIDIVNMVNSYTEYSPSKTGLHIICKGNFEGTGRKQQLNKNTGEAIEIYRIGRYFTMTGNVYMNRPIETRQKAINDIYDKYFKQSKPIQQHKQSGSPSDYLEIGLKKDRVFASLWNGERPNGNESSDDIGLMNKLAYWLNCDKPAMIEAFTQSPHTLSKDESHAKKLCRVDYLDRTADKAITECTKTAAESNAEYQSGLQSYSVEFKKQDKYTELFNGYNFGNYFLKDSGIWKEITKKVRGETITENALICNTVIVPVAILENLEDDSEKIELCYLKRKEWHKKIFNRTTLANSGDITKLAEYGIAIDSSNSRDMVQYFTEIISKNENIIPCKKSCSHMGWANENFMPYAENIVFDGEDNYKDLYRSIMQCGDYSKWRNYVTKLRSNIYLRLTMAAAFASPLIHKIGALPFIFHLWGGTGAGKTVALMVAASIWGNPQAGKYLRTLNGTENALMQTAGFLNSMPCICDELQTIRFNGGNYDRLIMKLCEGIDRGRMTYDKLNAVKSWCNSFILSGEEPCTKASSGGGVKNRVFEIEVVEQIIQDGNTTANLVRENYGFAGKVFIDHIQTVDLQGKYKKLLHEAMELADFATDKQISIAAILLLADQLACECVFIDDKPLNVDCITPFLPDESEVSAPERAYDFIISKVSANPDR